MSSQNADWTNVLKLRECPICKNYIKEKNDILCYECQIINDNKLIKMIQGDNNE